MNPDNSVLEAFNLYGKPEALPGGQGKSCKVGGFVLKMVGFDRSSHWTAETLSKLNPVGYRISRPIRSREGPFIFNGWTCSRFEAGNPVDGQELRKLEVSRLFHRSLGSIDLNEYVPPDNQWESAHRVAWLQRSLPSETNSDASEYIGQLLKFIYPEDNVKPRSFMEIWLGIFFLMIVMIR